MALGGCKAVVLEHRPDELIVKTQHLVKQLTIFNMITLLISVKLHGVGYHLFFSDVLEKQEFRLVLVVVVSVGPVIVTVEETTSCTLSTRHARTDSPVGDSGRALDGGSARGHHSFHLVLEILDLAHYLGDLFLSVVLLNATLTDSEESLFVDEVAGTGSACELAIYTLPVLLEITLDVLQPVQRRHLARLFGWLWWRLLSVWGPLELVGRWLHARLGLGGALAVGLVHVARWVGKVSRVLTIYKITVQISEKMFDTSKYGLKIPKVSKTLIKDWPLKLTFLLAFSVLLACQSEGVQIR